MTIRQNYSAPNYGTNEQDLLDDDDATSPTDGYFGDRETQVPNEVFVANPQNTDKKGALEFSGSSSPVDKRSNAYTPQTSNLTPASSRRDSGSVHNAFPGRYRDGPHELQAEVLDAPPEYSETAPSQTSEAPRMINSQQPYQDDPIPEVSTPLLRPPSPAERDPSSVSPMQSDTGASQPRQGRRSDFSSWKNRFSLPMYHKSPEKKGRRSCWGHWRHRREKQRQKKKFLFCSFLAAIFGICLLVLIVRSNWVSRSFRLVPCLHSSLDARSYFR